MHRGNDDRRERRWHDRTTLLRDTERLAKQRLRRSGAETNEDAWLDQRNLGFEPGPARRHLRRVRFRVDPPLAPRLPLERLHDVGHVHDLAVDACLLQRAIEQPAGGPDERLSRDIFGVARLLADEHDAGAGWSVAEDRLGS